MRKFSVQGMVYDGITLKLQHLMQRSIIYQHHHLNYKECLENGLVSNLLKNNKRPETYTQWQGIEITKDVKLVKTNILV